MTTITPELREPEKRKVCTVCKKNKVFSEFSRESKVKSGIRSICKKCSQDYKKTYVPDSDRLRELARKPQARRMKKQRYLRLKDDPEEKKKSLLTVLRYNASHKEEIAAHKLVKEAVRKGLLRKELCAVCGTDVRVHGHHPDYKQPLKVIWLCHTHHAQYHLVQKRCDKIINPTEREALARAEERKERVAVFRPNTLTIRLTARNEADQLDEVRHVISFEQIKSGRSFLQKFLEDMLLKITTAPILRSLLTQPSNTDLEKEKSQWGTSRPEEWKLTPPQNYRDMHARGFIEAVCAHGIGHHKGVHGCDGCCKDVPKEIWDKVTED